MLTRTANADDGRAVDVLLTDAGTELAARLQVRTADDLSALTNTLTRTDQRRLHSLLARILDTG